jgi:hypothetical protein
MRYLSLILLAACGSTRPVVTWTVARPTSEERVEVRENGEIVFTATNGGVEEKPESLRMEKEQVSELGDLLRSQHACELAHDPAYTPTPDEGQITLVIAFSDQHCKVTMSASEWLRGRAHEISETMRSMRTRPKRSGP